MLIHTTTSLCRVCKNAVAADVVERGSEVWMQKRCAEHGAQEVRLSSSVEWYRKTRAIVPFAAPPQRTAVEVEHGCPFDCGPCASHTQKVRLPVVTITSACNLDCPICYVHNKNEGAYNMSREEFASILGHLRVENGGDIDLINLTGGEPTLHPDLLGLLELAREAGVHRVSVCSNGLRLARDEGFVRELARLGARIALSFDTFDRHADQLMQGATLLPTKLRALELLAEHGVDTTLIPVMTRGVNDHEIGQILELGLSYPNIRHIEVHTITYTGQSGVNFQEGGERPRSGRISMDEVLAQIEATTGGLLRATDFVSSPCAHPLCYQIAYLLMDSEGGPPIPLSRLIPPEVLYDCLGDHLYIEPSRKLEEAMREGIERLWASDAPEAERALRVVKRLLAEVFPTDRPVSRETALRTLEGAAKAVYIHSHMDEDNFDTERLAQCCDSNCYADGKQVPVCSYNVLYREKEANFMAAPQGWNERRGGTRFPLLPIIG